MKSTAGVRGFEVVQYAGDNFDCAVSCTFWELLLGRRAVTFRGWMMQSGRRVGTVAAGVEDLLASSEVVGRNSSDLGCTPSPRVIQSGMVQGTMPILCYALGRPNR